jgi:hypothetical protein
MSEHTDFTKIILANYSQAELRRLHRLAELMAFVRSDSLATNQGQ